MGAKIKTPETNTATGRTDMAAQPKLMTNAEIIELARSIRRSPDDSRLKERARAIVGAYAQLSFASAMLRGEPFEFDLHGGYDKRWVPGMLARLRSLAVELGARVVERKKKDGTLTLRVEPPRLN
jgi:hypothetical protein